MDIILDSETAEEIFAADTEKIVSYFDKAAELAVKGEGLDGFYGEVSLSFVSPKEIRELNNEHRGHDKVTDVLSFPQYDDPGQIDDTMPYLLGDVVICADRAEEQAAEYGHSFERELVYLFVHSMMHLLGYDHMDEDEKKIMREKEESVMSALDLSRV